jgi:hypothetical protein
MRCRALEKVVKVNIHSLFNEKLLVTMLFACFDVKMLLSGQRTVVQ